MNWYAYSQSFMCNSKTQKALETRNFFIIYLASKLDLKSFLGKPTWPDMKLFIFCLLFISVNMNTYTFSCKHVIIFDYKIHILGRITKYMPGYLPKIPNINEFRNTPGLVGLWFRMMSLCLHSFHHFPCGLGLHIFSCYK